MPVPPSGAPPAPAAPIARLAGVEFGFAKGPRVLRGVNLNLPAGSFHFLTGPSGSGKSTLLRLLTLTARAQGGLVQLFGRDVSTAARRDLPALRRRMGVVFQDFRLLDHLSVLDNAALPLRLAGGKRRDYEGDVREMLDWVGLGDRLDARPAELSGGEKQRLAIARAIVGRPDLILADEPTGSVDAQMGDRLLRLFQSLNRMGVTVLIASHDAAAAAAFGATMLHLSDGQVVEAAA